MARRLQPEELRRRCDPGIFGVETTSECTPLDDVIGQERALRALDLGLGIKDFRYNIYVAGSPWHGKELHRPGISQKDQPQRASPTRSLLCS
jgi:hypothetical protein